MARKHAILGASSSERWMECPGSIRLSEGMPTEESSYAREGSAAHKLAEICLECGRDAIDFLGEDIPEYDDIPVDEGMVEAVQLYLDVIETEMDANPNREISVEVKFSLHHIYEGMFGTNDAVIYDPDTKELVVLDYKHGQGIPVEVERNSQLLYYAVGALTGKHNRPVKKVRLIIVQPRCVHPKGPVRQWATTPADVLDFVADLVDAAKLTEEPDAPLKVGDWCKFCPAAVICEEYEAFVVEEARAEFTEDGEVVVSAPETFTPENLALLLKNAHIIENWVKSVKQYAHSEAVKGEGPPGFKLVESRPQRKWRDKNNTKEALLDMGFSRDQIYQEPQLKSPNQLESLFKKKTKKAVKDMISSLWIKKSSGLNLVPDADDRDPARPDAKDEFA